jgi:CRISPR/Cas system-associated exonuclease Cas4 (RecB family)
MIYQKCYNVSCRAPLCVTVHECACGHCWEMSVAEDSVLMACPERLSLANRMGVLSGKVL